jgi:integrase
MARHLATTSPAARRHPSRIAARDDERHAMHDLPLSPEDRATLLTAVRALPPRDRLLAELVHGHGLTLADALSVRAEDIAWGGDHVKLTTRAPRAGRRTVTVARDGVDAILGTRRHGPVFATASGVPIRADYAARLLERTAAAAGVPDGISAKRGRSAPAIGSR